MTKLGAIASYNPRPLPKIFENGDSELVSEAMVLKRLLFTLLNNAQVIEKLAESRPIRRAAQITAFAIIKAQIAGKDAATKLLKSNTLRQIRHETTERMPRNVEELGKRAESLRQTFVKEVKEGMRDASTQIKNKNK